MQMARYSHHQLCREEETNGSKETAEWKGKDEFVRFKVRLNIVVCFSVSLNTILVKAEGAETNLLSDARMFEPYQASSGYI